jgi:hypothetical protein
MSVEDMPDERLVLYYENVRQQVEADRAGNHKFMMNPTVQQYADQLQSEMIKRCLEHSPIEWPQEMARKHREVVDEDGQQESNPVATGKSPMIGVRMHEEMQDLIKNPAEQNDHPSETPDECPYHRQDNADPDPTKFIASTVPNSHG